MESGLAGRKSPKVVAEHRARASDNGRHRRPGGAAAVGCHDDLSRWKKSFERHLRAEGKSEKTVETYGEAVNQLIRRVADEGIDHPRQIGRHHIEEYMVAVLDNDRLGRFATANNRFRSLQQFFRWLQKAEKAIFENPMAEMNPPKVPDKPVPLLADVELRRILGTCRTGSFEELRDEALIRLVADSGARRSEALSIECVGIDIDGLQAKVRAKGGGIRTIAFGKKTARALDRYERARAKHPYAHLDAFWLCRKGAFGPSGFYLMLKRRAAAAGLSLHPHQLRHIWAHESLKEMEEGDVQRLGGWKTRRMLDRYGAAGAHERAREAHRRHSFGDRL